MWPRRGAATSERGSLKAHKNGLNDHGEYEITERPAGRQVHADPDGFIGVDRISNGSGIISEVQADPGD